MLLCQSKGSSGKRAADGDSSEHAAKKSRSAQQKDLRKNMVHGEKKMLGGSSGKAPEGHADEVNFLPYELMQALRKKKETFPLTRLALEQFGLKTEFGQPKSGKGGKGGKGKGGKGGKGIKNWEAHAFKEENRNKFQEALKGCTHENPAVQVEP